MSSYRPNGTSKASKSSEAETLPCPECGTEAMRRHAGPCILLDGTKMSHLERWHCFSCGADFFDPAAMDKIAVVRQRRKAPTKAGKKVPEYA